MEFSEICGRMPFFNGEFMSHDDINFAMLCGAGIIIILLFFADFCKTRARMTDEEIEQDFIDRNW